VEWRSLRQDFERTEGAFDSLTENTLPLANLRTSVREKSAYREDTLTATVQQLLGDCWSIGADYRYTQAHLRQELGGHREAFERRLKQLNAVQFDQAGVVSLRQRGEREAEADLQHLQLQVRFHHPTGFFARAEAHWVKQDLSQPVTLFDFTEVDARTSKRPRLRRGDDAPPGDDFWQFHVAAGWRFRQGRCEISTGVLNLTDTDYRLDPLTPYAEMPRERTFFVRCRLSF
jgi:hypothetical protein